MLRRFAYSIELRLRAEQDNAQGRPTMFEARCRLLKQMVAVPVVRLRHERPASLNGLRPLPLARRRAVRLKFPGPS